MGSLPGQTGGKGASLHTGSWASLLPVPHLGAPPAWPPRCLPPPPQAAPGDANLQGRAGHPQVPVQRPVGGCVPQADGQPPYQPPGGCPPGRQQAEARALGTQGGDPSSGQSQQAQPPLGAPHKHPQPPAPGQAPRGWRPCLGLTRLVCTRTSFPLGAHAGLSWWPDGLGCIFSPPGTLEVVQQGRGGEDPRPWSEGPWVLVQPQRTAQD